MAAKKKLPDDCLPQCKTCCFYINDNKSDYGECRRFPPMIIPENNGCTFSFAMTQNNDWCGEYIRRVN